MLSVYIFLGVIGGVLILLSSLGVLGHGLDTDTSFDAGHEIDFQHDLGATDLAHIGADNVDHAIMDTGDVWFPFLSLRFWVYSSACFGLIGTLASLFSGAGEPKIFFISLLTGVLMGLVAAYTYRYLSRHEVQGGIGTADFVGALGKVLVSVGETKTGKVRMTIKGDTIDMLALSEVGHFEVGEEVMVTGLDGDKVTVVRKEEFLGD